MRAFGGRVAGLVFDLHNRPNGWACWFGLNFLVGVALMLGGVAKLVLTPLPLLPAANPFPFLGCLLVWPLIAAWLARCFGQARSDNWGRLRTPSLVIALYCCQPLFPSLALVALRCRR